MFLYVFIFQIIVMFKLYFFGWTKYLDWNQKFDQRRHLLFIGVPGVNFHRSFKVTQRQKFLFWK